MTKTDHSQYKNQLYQIYFNITDKVVSAGWHCWVESQSCSKLCNVSDWSGCPRSARISSIEICTGSIGPIFLHILQYSFFAGGTSLLETLFIQILGNSDNVMLQIKLYHKGPLLNSELLPQHLHNFVHQMHVICRCVHAAMVV